MSHHDLQTKAELTALTNYLGDPAALDARSRRQLQKSPWQKPVKAELEVLGHRGAIAAARSIAV